MEGALREHGGSMEGAWRGKRESEGRCRKDGGRVRRRQCMGGEEGRGEGMGGKGVGGQSAGEEGLGGAGRAGD